METNNDSGVDVALWLFAKGAEADALTEAPASARGPSNGALTVWVCDNG